MSILKGKVSLALTPFMTLYSFNQLDETEKETLIWEEGVMIDRRSIPQFKVLLFQIGSFYVEVFYHLQSRSIFRLKSFDNTHLLKPYLKKIDINGVLQ